METNEALSEKSMKQSGVEIKSSDDSQSKNYSNNSSEFLTPSTADRLNIDCKSAYYRSFGSNGTTTMSQLEAAQESASNEPLLGGFALLRVAQLLNFDIYYLGSTRKSNNKTVKLDPELACAVSSAPRLQSSSFASDYNKLPSISANPSSKPYKTLLDELASYNPIQKYIDKYSILDAFSRFLKICLSLSAIILGIDKTISNIVLCLNSNIESRGDTEEQANSSMGLSVLILVNLSSIYILFATVFNGHILWNLLSQRLFLVSKRFQCKTMMFLLIFVYLEYIVSIAFVNNLYEWDFTSNNIQSGSYSVFANLRIFLTEQDEEHNFIDILLTIIQFARGVIRISPYITINYAIICLIEHIKTIRNQHLLTDSLKKKQKLRLVVTNRSRKLEANNNSRDEAGVKKKKVIFVTNNSANNLLFASDNVVADDRRQTLSAGLNDDEMIQHVGGQESMRKNLETIYLGQIISGKMSKTGLRSSLELSESDQNLIKDSRMKQQPNSSTTNNNISSDSWFNTNNEHDTDHRLKPTKQRLSSHNKERKKNIYLAKINDFDELESYITNLYVFTGRLNRVMSRQGLTVFFIVHNLVITVSLIVPEAVRGGPIMAYIIRFLVILIGIMPFVIGESLNEQLEQLSKQIDRIIIQQQFIYTRRDNLVRIRELIHDIRVNCGGMLNFNMETGIKYLVVSFASAFFIEQERKFDIEKEKKIYQTNLFFLKTFTIDKHQLIPNQSSSS